MLNILAVTLLCLAFTGPAASQNQDSVRAQPPADTMAPVSAQVVLARADDLGVTAAAARATIAAQPSAATLSADLPVLQRRLDELHRQLAGLRDDAYLWPEALSRLQDQAVTHATRTGVARARITAATSTLETLRAQWTDRARLWNAWADSLGGDPLFGTLNNRVDNAIATSAAILNHIDSVAQPLSALRVQYDVESRRIEALTDDIRALRLQRRTHLFERSRPILFSAQHLQLLRTNRTWIGKPLAINRSFFNQNSSLLLVLVLLATALGFAARKVAPRVGDDDAWRRALQHPLAVSIFVPLALLADRFRPAPPLWELAVWGLLAISGSIIASGLFRNRPTRLLIYGLAGFYPVFVLLQAVGLPVPWFRLFLATAAFAGLVMSLVLLRSAHPPTRGLVWSVRVLAPAAAAVFIAEIFGFDHLARWVVQASVTSAFIVFVVVYIALLTRGAIHTYLRAESKARFPFLRTIAYSLAERAAWLVQAVLFVGAALYILDAWQLAPSPLETWNRIADAGFSLGDTRITVGRVLFAVLLIYAAGQISWVVRTFLRGEFLPGRDIDTGVADSALKLLHYSVVIAGILFALSTLGLKLQNFAIIVGALGVGIGFGLQNIVNNFVSGLILLFERPVRVGDTVIIGTEWGTITKIGLRSTRVATMDASELIVPNGELVSQTVVNWTLTDPVTRLVIDVGVAYGSDLEIVVRELLAAVASAPFTLAEPAPQAFFTEFGDSSLNFQLRVWVGNVNDRPFARSAILLEIDRRFRAAGVEIPFPQRDLHLRSVDGSVIDRLTTNAERAKGSDVTGDPTKS